VLVTAIELFATSALLSKALFGFTDHCLMLSIA